MFYFLLRLLIDKPYFLLVLLVLTFVYLFSLLKKKTSLNDSAKSFGNRNKLRIKFLSLEYESKFLGKAMEAVSVFFLDSPEFFDRIMIEQVVEFASIVITFAGVLVSIIFSVSTIMHIVHWTSHLCHLITSPNQEPQISIPPSFLQVNFILPGLGTGTDSFLEYLPIFIVVSLVHEFGHYFASMLNYVRPLAVQFKFAYFVPLSSVQLDVESYAQLPKRKKLGILTCGIFSNFVLCLLLQVVMFLVGFFNIYNSEGVTVWEIRDANHPIISQPGINGLQLNDRIEKINGCPTTSLGMYKRCLHEISLSPPIGFCVKERLNFDVDLGQPPEPQEFIMPFVFNIFPEVPKCLHRFEIYAYDSTHRHLRTCVHLRRMIRLEQKRRGASLRYCRQLDDCDKEAGEYCLIGDADYAASVATTSVQDPPFEKFCIYFIEKNSDSSKLVVFVGVTNDFFNPFFVIQENLLLEFLKKFYDVALSFGFFNLLPCFNFDGYWLLVELVGLLGIRESGKICLVRVISQGMALCVLLHLGVSLWWAETPSF